MVYDLIVVGNGLAAQTFLFEFRELLSANDLHCQNFSIAQIYSEEIAPSCSLRSTATVSLNGIEEDVSELGNYLRESYFSFVHFNQLHGPSGVEEVKRQVLATSELHEKKLIRRFSAIAPLAYPLIKNQFKGVKISSYLISPEKYGDWFNQKNKKTSAQKIVQYKNFLLSSEIDSEGLINCHMLGGESIRGKKILFCTGAYAKIYAAFFEGTEELAQTDVVAGSYLQRSVDLKMDSQYITIDGHTLIYRSFDKCLLIGSSSIKDSLVVGDISELRDLYNLFLENTLIDLGSFDQFSIITGLRHKTKRRLPMSRALNAEKSIYMMNGYYKNGFSFSLYFAKKMAAEIFESFNQ